MTLLPWLARNGDVARELDALTDTRDAMARIRLYQHLSQSRLSLAQATRLSKMIASDDELAPSRARAHGLAHSTVWVLAEGTFDHVLPWIPLAGLRRRTIISPKLGPYDQIFQALMSDDLSCPDQSQGYVLLVPDIARRVAANYPFEVNASSAARSAFDEIESLARLASERLGLRVITTTAVPRSPRIFGELEQEIDRSRRAAEIEVNRLIRDGARQGGYGLVDIAGLGDQYGSDVVFDRRLWLKGRYVVSPVVAELVADHVSRPIACDAGKSRKLLVLDLDNTLWGGIVGEAGIEGLELGEGTPVGEAHDAFQRHIQELMRRGIVLAVCSKNDSSLAVKAIETRDGMVLKLEDFAAIEANWSNKADNIVAIARRLDLGIDSVVFVDDSAVERHLVRSELPMVAVPEMSDDPAEYARILSVAGYFEATSLVAEDAQRAKQYRDNSKRDAVRATTRNLEEFLASLDQVATIQPWSEGDHARIVQLINKTNQFNLCTRRFTVEELRKFVDAPESIVLSLRISDRFGDTGLVGVAMATPFKGDVKTYECVNFLMSCRVLARGVENALFSALTVAASWKGADRLVGRYVATDRNGLVEGFYPTQGLVQRDGMRDQVGIEYIIDLEKFVPRPFIGRIGDK